MKYLLMIPVLVGILASTAFASRTGVPLADVVQDSDIIVIGTLTQVREYSDKGMDYGSGTIRVKEMIWGAVLKDQHLTLTWENPTGVICPRTEHKGEENKKGIWLLTFDRQGNARADYPERFAKLKDKDKVIDALMKKNVRLKVSKRDILPDEPIEISLIFRNPTTQRQLYSGLEYSNGYLYSNSKIELELLRGWGEEPKKIAPLANKIFVSETLLPILIEPGQEHRIAFNLRDFFDFPSDVSSEYTEENYYVFKISTKEFANPNQIYFYHKLANKEERGISSSGKRGKAIETFYHNKDELTAELALHIAM